MAVVDLETLKSKSAKSVTSDTSEGRSILSRKFKFKLLDIIINEFHGPNLQAVKHKWISLWSHVRSHFLNKNTDIFYGKNDIHKYSNKVRRKK